MQPYNTFIKRWKHKLFGCHTFYQSIWNNLFHNKPFYRCPKCNKALHCYWDGNDTSEGTDICDECVKKYNLK